MPFVRITNTNLKQVLQASTAKLPANNWMTFQEKAIEGDYEADKFPSPPRTMKEYDIVVGGTTGGGGYGDPLDRDPALVMKDLEEGLISHKVAEDVYKVAYNHDLLMVDAQATEQLRNDEREARKKRGVSFAEFEKQWLKLRPSGDILRFYGDWPETKYDSFVTFGDWHEE